MARQRRVGGNPAEAQAPKQKAVVVVCSGCSQHLKVKAESVGKKVKCPHCNTALLVPAVKET